ncbi:UDP-2,4-diacetamido-2,4,6-trideoxy-beta-L-altropyranose hydrolase [Natranaerovirga pectinivora]|uniref:UDP-2,4-diacetamido-2,4, 6-trideoxy-beta-L-altropyranose hydrolase n=1 Tax=Natranaerovirga pectinivora TaxID=682400 RepID=A0A4R3MPC6_9FIRM|nr:UDP-2,4-diacetamido-2,4,6-trideoxy-beta-L-altropyranose hydrolase [Natranaerovirga pectinivora]TCT14038.1 UDP-2,4-diacetamido-2,4,6-trideoxy-beta-L-altropyranose hydrolase [Natranaerovirga pectinivora]
MRVIIRADGGSNIGMGHIMRTSVIAQKLQEFSEVIYVCKKGNEFENGIQYLKKQGYEVRETDRVNIISDLSLLKGNCLITDSYDIDEKYFALTKDIFPITGYIDDLNQYKLNVDFVINQNIYAQDLIYDVCTNTQLFLGPQYALLRDEFLNPPKNRINKNIKNIIITLGGCDTQNLTGEIIENLYRDFSDIVFHVVVGPGFRNTELRKLELENVKLYYNPKMVEIMLKSDLAISACGSTLYELAACGIPTIGVIVAENQKRAALKMKELGIIELAEEHSALKQAIKVLDYNKRKKMSQYLNKLVDGFGAKRISEEIYSLLTNGDK